jgi:hypothetical protein
MSEKTSNFFTPFTTWVSSLLVTWISDSPETRFDDNQFDILSLATSRRLAALLEYMSPLLLTQLQHIVIFHTQLCKELKVKLEAKLQEQQDILETEASERAAIIPTELSYPEPTLELPVPPAKDKLEFVFAIALGFMLFLGVCEYMGIELQNLSLNKIERVILLAIAIAFSTLLTLAIKKAVEGSVLSVRRFEPDRRLHSDFTDDNQFAKNIAFWQRFLDGDSAVWASLGFVLLEMFFTAPGLLGLLSPTLKANPLSQMTAYAGASFTAYSNVLFAWGKAGQKLIYERDFAKSKEKHRTDCEKSDTWIKAENANLKNDSKHQEIIAKNQTHLQNAEAAKTKGAHIARQIEDLKKEVAQAQKDAINECERWFLAYKKLLKDNPKMVQEFNKLYPLQPYPISSSSTIESLNGHKKSASPIFPVPLETKD